MESRRIRIADVVENKGQVPGLPSNPRQWKKAELEKAELEKAEREKAERWELSPRELAIVAKLSANGRK